MSNIHITKRSDGSWNVVQAGTGLNYGSFRRQSDAIDSGRPIARMMNAELVIHDRNNRIRDKDSYGNDPFPPRDTRF